MLLGAMVLCYQMGHIYYTLLLIGFGFQCHFELMNINRKDVLEAKNPAQKVIEWFLPILFAFYLTPKLFMRRVLLEKSGDITEFATAHTVLHAVFFKHHTFICGFGLIIGLVIFTLSLKKGQYRY